MSVRVDHLVVFCRSLDQGSAWCRETLGAEPVAGGKHVLMGTHNRLLRLSSASHPDTYLELLAIDPDAPSPTRARWFGIDHPVVRAAAESAPVLVAWVGRSKQVDAHRAALIAIGLQPGDAVAASRDTPRGLLRWQIVLRADGTLPMGGALPVLIEWQGPHPATGLPHSGVALRQLSVRGLSSQQCEVMRLRDVGCLAGDAPAFDVALDTPLGERVLHCFGG